MNHLRAIHASLLSLALVPLACSDAAPTEDPSSADIARDAVERLAAGDVDAVADYFADDFVDHRTGATGTTDLEAATLATAADHPDAATRVYRVISEGELVFVHSHLTLEPGTLGTAVADIFRFEDGRIAERWGTRQDVPATTASGNDMFSTLSSPQRFDPDPAISADATRGVMAELATALIVDKDLDAWDRLVAPPYYQHSTNTPNGVDAVKEVWGPIIADPTIVITPVVSLAEGDLFVTMNMIDSPMLHLSTVDVSRVREGLILEHWDVVEFR